MSQDSKGGSLCFSFLICKVGLMLALPSTVNSRITCLRPCLAQRNVSVKFTCYYVPQNESGDTLGKCYRGVMLTPQLWKDEVLPFQKLMDLKRARSWFSPSTGRFGGWCGYLGEGSRRGPSLRGVDSPVEKRETKHTIQWLITSNMMIVLRENYLCCKSTFWTSGSKTLFCPTYTHEYQPPTGAASGTSRANKWRAWGHVSITPTVPSQFGKKKKIKHVMCLYCQPSSPIIYPKGTHLCFSRFLNTLREKITEDPEGENNVDSRIKIFNIIIVIVTIC